MKNTSGVWMAVGASVGLFLMVVGCSITIPPFPPWPPTSTTTTTTIPPVPPVGTNGFEAVFDHQESRDSWKCSSLLNTSYGLFTGILNDISRQNIELWLAGKKIYSGSQETISQPIEWNGAVYFPTESDGDKKGLRYKDGQLTETCKLRHSAASIVYRDQPCFISSEDRGEMIVNAETGADVLKLAVEAKIGIPFAACYFGTQKEVIVALTDGEGREGLVTTTGVFIPMAGSIAVENWNGKIMAAAGGKIYTVSIDNKTTTEYFDTKCVYVNQLWYDAENKVMWVSCTGPDKLLYFDASGVMREVITVGSSGDAKMFKTRITKGWWVCGSKATWYKIQKKSPNPPNPGPVVYIPGDIRDKGGEIWNNNFNGMDVRLSADDVEHLPAGVKGSWYPLDGSVVPSGTVRLSLDESGNTVVGSSDFNSTRTGLRYHYMGVLVNYDSTPLITENPHTILKKDCHHTLRIMYATIQSPAHWYRFWRWFSK